MAVDPPVAESRVERLSALKCSSSKHLAASEKVRRGYEVQARRLEPIGLVYLWPATN